VAKSSQDLDKPRLLAVELWGIGDLALAMPFLCEASRHTDVTLVAKPHAASLIARFAPKVELVPLVAPWTAFRGKYRLHLWRWGDLFRAVRKLRKRQFEIGVSARRDPRDHLLLRLAAPQRRIGFPAAGSGVVLTHALPPPIRPHRAEHWRTLAESLGWKIPLRPTDGRSRPAGGRQIVIHAGAAQPIRQWPLDRYESLAAKLRANAWTVTLLDDNLNSVPQLLDYLAGADRFIGNDSGPGHLAALLGVPTFTIFGPQLPELFGPQHPQAAWIEGSPCPHKPCFDSCRFTKPHCLLDVSVDAVWGRLSTWLAS
jgi:heptosyltransferase-2